MCVAPSSTRSARTRIATCWYQSSGISTRVWPALPYAFPASASANALSRSIRPAVHAGLHPDVPLDVLDGLLACQGRATRRWCATRSANDCVVPPGATNDPCEESAASRRGPRHDRRPVEGVEDVPVQHLGALTIQSTRNETRLNTVRRQHPGQQQRPIESVAGQGGERAFRAAQRTGVRLVVDVVPDERKHRMHVRADRLRPGIRIVLGCQDA